MLQANNAFITTSPVASASAITDPVAALLKEHAAEWAAMANSEGDGCTNYARCVEIDEELETAKATTSEGAAGSLEYLRADLLEHVLCDLPPKHQRLCLGLIDSALGVLRSQLELSTRGLTIC